MSQCGDHELWPMLAILYWSMKDLVVEPSPFDDRTSFLNPEAFPLLLLAKVMMHTLESSVTTDLWTAMSTNS